MVSARADWSRAREPGFLAQPMERCRVTDLNVNDGVADQHTLGDASGGVRGRVRTTRDEALSTRMAGDVGYGGVDQLT